MHPWIHRITRRIVNLIEEALIGTSLVFILTLLLTVICALAVIKLSDTPRFGWLKRIYA